MLKISQLISQPVINIFNVKIEGFVEKVLFNPDRKKAENLIIYDEKEDIYKIVKFLDVNKFGKDAILIKNSSKITLFENMELENSSFINPLNSISYDINGDILGTNNEIIVDRNGLITKLIAKDKSYYLKDIVGINDGITLLSPDKPVSIKKYRDVPQKISSLVKINSEPIVNILSNTPQKENSTYSFLLNRTILKDIKNSTGEVIARENTIVNHNTITKLKYYGKLKELTLNSK